MVSNVFEMGQRRMDKLERWWGGYWLGRGKVGRLRKEGERGGGAREGVIMARYKYEAPQEIKCHPLWLFYLKYV